MWHRLLVHCIYFVLHVVLVSALLYCVLFPPTMEYHLPHNLCSWGRGRAAANVPLHQPQKSRCEEILRESERPCWSMEGRWEMSAQGGFHRPGRRSRERPANQGVSLEVMFLYLKLAIFGSMLFYLLKIRTILLNIFKIFSLSWQDRTGLVWSAFGKVDASVAISETDGAS